MLPRQQALLRHAATALFTILMLFLSALGVSLDDGLRNAATRPSSRQRQMTAVASGHAELECGRARRHNWVKNDYFVLLFAFINNSPAAAALAAGIGSVA